MKFYTIYPSKNIDRDFSFDLKGNQDRVVDFFKFDDSNSGFLKSPRINLTYDEEFSIELDDILNSDFYHSSSGILLFSKRFYEKLEAELSSECEFFKCLINNLDSDVYALNIKNKFSILDENEKIVENKNFSVDYILKDEGKPYIYMVTDNFLKLVQDNKFKMEFLEFN
ncbi:hypothetical protein ACG93R_07340 [Acinetobacter guillouiae]|uniref:hypothetical protein n=1 Tax=Acinetobacter guillouiae TaxID=106649 RepID=UPI003AF7F1D4